MLEQLQLRTISVITNLHYAGDIFNRTQNSQTAQHDSLFPCQEAVALGVRLAVQAVVRLS